MEMKSTSSGTVGSLVRMSSRATLAFSTSTSSSKSLKDAVGLSSGGEILTVLVCARHLAAAIVGSFCLAASAYKKAWEGGVWVVGGVLLAASISSSAVVDMYCAVLCRSSFTSLMTQVMMEAEEVFIEVTSHSASM